jgi:hypothetical protein
LKREKKKLSFSNEAMLAMSGPNVFFAGLPDPTLNALLDAGISSAFVCPRRR